MIEIKKVDSKKLQREFVKFPLKLYKGNPNYVPPLYLDEINVFYPEKNVYHKESESVFFLAYDGKKVVGRISGIIQDAYNKKAHDRCVRFTRFHSINNQEVANKLFDAVESWAKEKGCINVRGPLGYSDLEREGLLVEGFDELSTFEEEYNYEYYGKLIENCGYKKDVDWLEYKVFTPQTPNEKLERISDKVMQRYNLHFLKCKSMNDFLKNHSGQFLDVIDECYSSLYGVVPLNEDVRKQLISQFKLIVNLKYVICIMDKDERMVACGVAFPSIARAVNKSKGKLLPFGVLRILHSVHHPKILDFALIGVIPEYRDKGVNAIILNQIMHGMKLAKVEYAETNLELEDNIKIHNQWNSFKTEQHKRRRSYIKLLK
jgi:hypothetical protein